ncbi:unnamed protein product [Rotaria sp. Silwood1]|nr:unnamed protein product [Rotaria sp. Silwood1]CAF4686840.1 unnamed protein product [Rotaria sp. Silwood1]
MTGIFGPMMIIALAMMLTINTVDSYRKRGVIKASASDFGLEQEDLDEMKRAIFKQSCSSTAGGSSPVGSYACWFGGGISLVQCTGSGSIGDGWATVNQCENKCYMNGNGNIVCE